MRKEIQANVQHAGQKFEIVKQAYDEIRIAQGKEKSKYTNSCSGCIHSMNQILVNWLKKYDELSPSTQRLTVAPTFQPLTVAKKTEVETKEPSYKELLERFNKDATPEQKEALLSGRRTPKKDELIQFFNGK